MEKQDGAFVWTEKAARFSKKNIAGETATMNGRPIKDSDLARSWEEKGFIRRRAA